MSNTFKEYCQLMESRGTQIDENTAVSLIEKHCSKNLAMIQKFGMPTLYRGSNNDKPFVRLDPKKFERKSRNTQNYYTLIMDNSPEWKEYPKRSRSAICTSNIDKTWGYGDPFVVIPYDGAKLGVCPERDLWYSFEKIHDHGVASMDDFNVALQGMIESILGKRAADNLDKNFSTFQTYLSMFDAQAETIPPADFWGEIEGSSVNQGLPGKIRKRYKGDLYKLLESLLNPEKNRFKLIDFSETPDVCRDGYHELWTDSECILVKQDWFSALKFK